MKFRIICSILLLIGLNLGCGLSFGTLETTLVELNDNLTTLNKIINPQEERTITLTFPFKFSIIDYVKDNAPYESIEPLFRSLEYLFYDANSRLTLASFEVPLSLNLDSFKYLLQQQKNFAPHFFIIKDIKVQNNDIIADIEYLNFNKEPLTKDTLINSLEQNNTLNKYFKSAQQPMDFLPTSVTLKTFKSPTEAQEELNTTPSQKLKALLINKPIKIENLQFLLFLSEEAGTAVYKFDL